LAATLIAVLLIGQSHAPKGSPAPLPPEAVSGFNVPVCRRGRGRQRLRQAEQLLRLFRGREDHVAVARGKGFAPEPLTAPITAERLAEEHLAGSRCLGFYLMRPDGTVWCSCPDFDNKPDRPDPAWKEKTEKVYSLLVKHDISPLIEVSQSGLAAHVWLFLESPVSAWVVRAFWHGVLRTLNILPPEISPRQAELAGKKLNRCTQ
jgi:hypothetical protein